MIRAVLARAVGRTRSSRLPVDDTSAPALLWLIPAVWYYSLLVAFPATGLSAPVTYGLTFNSMLLHLLQGRFDVDPAAIGIEGYVRDGSVFAYFGIFPALLRAILLPLPQFAT